MNFKLYKEEEKYSQLYYEHQKLDEKQDKNVPNTEIIKNTNVNGDDLLNENVDLKNK